MKCYGTSYRSEFIEEATKKVKQRQQNFPHRINLHCERAEVSSFQQTPSTLIHNILLEKQNVKISMYNLECRSFKLNTTAGPGCVHTHTGKLTHNKEILQYANPISTLLKLASPWSHTCTAFEAIHCT